MILHFIKRLFYHIVLGTGLLFLYPFISHSQEIDLRFAHLGEKQGLKYNRHNVFVKKDSKGFVWISSEQGCYRFDGQRVKHYRVDQEGLYNGNIQSTFFEDAKGDLWFTTVDALHRYNRQADKIESESLENDNFKIKDACHAFHFNPTTHTLWLNDDTLMWAYNVEEKIPKPFFLKTRGVRFTVDTSSGKVTRIFAFPWWKGKGIGLDYTYPAILPFDNPLERENGNRVVSKNIIEDSSYHRIWVLTQKNGLYVFSLDKQLLFHFANIGEHSDFSSSHLSIDAEGVLWLIVDNDIYRYETKTNRQPGRWQLVYPGEERLISLYHGVPGRKIVIGTTGVFYLVKKESEFYLDRMPLFKDYENYEFDHFFKVNDNTTFVPYLDFSYLQKSEKIREFSSSA